VHRGVSCAIFLAPVMEHDLDHVPERYARIAQALGIEREGRGDVELARSGIIEVHRLVAELETPTRSPRRMLNASSTRPWEMPDGTDDRRHERRISRPRLAADELLAADGIEARVVNVHTLEPLDREAVLSAAETGALVTVEDHSVHAGLGRRRV